MKGRPDDPMRLCLLGCGRVADAHSGRLARLRPAVTLSYASRSIDKAQALASKHGGAHAFGSYREAIDRADIDVVAVLTPPSSHLEWTLAALTSGKDVILEKPPVLASSDFDEIERAGRAAGRFVYVAENYFYKPVLAAIRKALGSGAIGEPLFIHLNAVKRQRTGGWRDDPAEVGGGALFEGGIHWVNFAGALGFTIASVKAARPGPGEGLERSMALLFEYAEGPVGLLCTRGTSRRSSEASASRESMDVRAASCSNPTACSWRPPAASGASGVPGSATCSATMRCSPTSCGPGAPGPSRA